jgi:hypothetical protein
VIDRERLRELREAEAPFDPTGGLGLGKGWRGPFEVIARLIGHRTDEEFAEWEPRFDRAYKDFNAWIRRLKCDPDRNGGRRFIDPEFGAVMHHLWAALSGSNLTHNPVMGSRKLDIANRIMGLCGKLGYVPRGAGGIDF